jgi:hypothetical protein
MPVISKDQVYSSCNPRGGPQIRITGYRPGETHANIVDAHSGKRFRRISVKQLHDSKVTRRGTLRRTGYALVREAMTSERWAYIVRLDKEAVPGPWEAYDAPDHWSLHVKGAPFQILKAPKRNTPYAEYWPDLVTGDFIAQSRTMVTDLTQEVARLREELERHQLNAEYFRQLSLDKISEKRRMVKELRNAREVVESLEEVLHDTPPPLPEVLELCMKDLATVISDPGSVVERETVNGSPESVPRWAARAVVEWLPSALTEALHYLERSRQIHARFVDVLRGEQQAVYRDQMRHADIMEEAVDIVSDLLFMLPTSKQNQDAQVNAQNLVRILRGTYRTMPRAGDMR